MCQSSVINSEPMMPPYEDQQQRATRALTPNRFMKAAANGPIRPKRTSRSARALEEYRPFVHPNSFSSGRMRMPAEPMPPRPRA